MRIALIYDALFPYVIGGAEHRNYSLASVLSSHHDVALYSFHYWADDPAGCLPRCRYVPVGPPSALYSRAGRRRIAEALIFAARLLVPLLRSREDIWDLSSFPYFSVPTARLVGLLRKTPMVVTWHEYWGDYWHEYLGCLGWLGRAVEKAALWCSPHIITVSQQTRRRLTAAGYPDARISVVPNGLFPEQIVRVAPAQRSFTLIYAGRLVAHKQLDLLLRAVSMLHKDAPAITLGIIGEGPERERLLRLTLDLGLQDSVIFLGRLPTEADVFAQFKSSRVLVLPSRREGFGMAIIQGWACGLPAVVCKEPNSALPELIDDPIKGRVVPSNPAALAVACRDLLARPPEAYREHLLDAAKAYDWREMSQRLIAAYQDATGGKI